MRPRLALCFVTGLIAFAFITGSAFTQTLLPDDLQPGQWGLHNTGQDGGTPDVDIDAPEAWAHRTGAPEIIIAVIGNGVDLQHPDLSDNLWVNPDEIGGNGVDDDGNGFVDDVHGADFIYNDGDPSEVQFEGTHIAGILGAVGDNGVGIAGTAWSIRIMPLRVTDVNGRTNYARISMAARYAGEKGADIILLPMGDFDFGFFPDVYLQMLVDATADSLLVVPVGDAGSELTEEQLEKFLMLQPWESSIRVTAIDRTGALWPQANRAEGLADIAAPGVDILSTTPSVSNTYMDELGVATEYDTLSGSAQAAAHVAGALALLMAERPELPKTHCKSQLLAAADRFESLEPIVFGGRRLNAIRPLTEDHDAEINLPPSITIIELPFFIDLNEAYTLDASFTDDPFQLPIGEWTVQWEQVAGPPNPQGGEYQAEFLNPDAVALEFSCPHPGPYTFRLSVDDGYTVGTAATSVYVRHDPEVNPGPELHWKFDGSFADASGNGNDGTVIGGNPGFVAMPVLGETGAFSYGDTVETELYTGGAPIWSLAFWIRSEGYDRLRIRFEDAFYISFRDRPILFQEVGTGGSSFSGLANSAPADVWAHIGITCDGESLRWWVNGSLLGSTQDDEWRKVSDLRLAPGISRLLLEYPEDGRTVLQVPIDDLRVHVGYCMTEADFAAIVDPVIAADPPPTMESMTLLRVPGPGEHQLYANFWDNGFPSEKFTCQWTLNDPDGTATLVEPNTAEPILDVAECGRWDLQVSVDDGWHTVTGLTTVECVGVEDTPNINYQNDNLAIEKMCLHPTEPHLLFLDDADTIWRYSYEAGEIEILFQPDFSLNSFDISPDGTYLMLSSGPTGLWKVMLSDFSMQQFPYPGHLPYYGGPEIAIMKDGTVFFAPFLHEFDPVTENIRLRYDLLESPNNGPYEEIDFFANYTPGRSKILAMGRLQSGLALFDPEADRMLGDASLSKCNYLPLPEATAINADGSLVAYYRNQYLNIDPDQFAVSSPDFLRPIMLLYQNDSTPVFHPREPLLLTFRNWNLFATDLETMRPLYKVPQLFTTWSRPDTLLIHPDGARAFAKQGTAFVDFALPSRTDFRAIEAVEDYVAVHHAEVHTGLPNVLANDRYVGGGDRPELQAELVLGPSGASHFELHPDGSFEYLPAPGFQGIDRFLYRCSGDGLEDNTLAYIEVIGPDYPEFMIPVRDELLDRAVSGLDVVDMVLDDRHNILYFTLNDGLIRRVDLENRCLLPPLGPVSVASRLDVSPDGEYLYAVSKFEPMLGGAHALINTQTGAVEVIPAQPFMAGSKHGFFLDNDTVKLSQGNHLFHLNGRHWTVNPEGEGLAQHWLVRTRDYGGLLGVDLDTREVLRLNSADLTIARFGMQLEESQERRFFVNADGSLWAIENQLIKAGEAPLRTIELPADWAFPPVPGMPAIARDGYHPGFSMFDTETGTPLATFTSHYSNPYRTGKLGLLYGIPPLVTADGAWMIHATKQGILFIPIPDPNPPVAPRPVGDLYFVEPGGVLEVDVTNGLCSNDWRLPEQYTVELKKLPGPEGLELEPDGSFRFTPPEEGTWSSFSYFISSPSGVSNTAVVYIFVRSEDQSHQYSIPLNGLFDFVFDDPRNRLLTVNAMGDIYSLALDTGKLVLEVETGIQFSSIEISPDGRSCYCISGELAPWEGWVVEVDLDTGATRRMPLTGERLGARLDVQNRLRIMADGTCFAGRRLLDLATGRLGDVVFPFESDPVGLGEVFRSGDRRVFTVRDGINSYAWVDGQVFYYPGMTLLGGDAELGLVVSRYGQLHKTDGSPSAIPPVVRAQNRFHTATQSIISIGDPGIVLYPVGAQTPAYVLPHYFSYDPNHWTIPSRFATGGQHPNAAFGINDTGVKIYSFPDPPAAAWLYPMDDIFLAQPGGDLTLDGGALQVNDRFPEGVQPQVLLTAAPAHGVLTGVEVGSLLSGSLVYRPAAGFSGEDSFRYRLFADGLASEFEAVVRLRVQSGPLNDVMLPVDSPKDIAFDPVLDTLFISTPAGVMRYSVGEDRFIETLAPDEAFTRLDVNPGRNQLFAVREDLVELQVWDLDQPDQSYTSKIAVGDRIFDLGLFGPDSGMLMIRQGGDQLSAYLNCFAFPTDQPEALIDLGFRTTGRYSAMVDRSRGSAAAIDRTTLKVWESATRWWEFPSEFPISTNNGGDAAIDLRQNLLVFQNKVYRTNGSLLGEIDHLCPSSIDPPYDLNGGLRFHPEMDLLVVLWASTDRLFLFDTSNWELIMTVDLPFDVPYYYINKNSCEIEWDTLRNQAYIKGPEGIFIIPLYGESPFFATFTTVNDPGAVLTPVGPREVVMPNSVLELEVTPSAGHQFSHWTITPGTAGYFADPEAPQTTVTLLRGARVEAHLIDASQACTPRFEVNDPRWGSAGPADPMNGLPVMGSTIEIEAKPYSGMTFLGWLTTEGGVIADPSAAVTQLTLMKDPVVTAFFAPETFYSRYPVGTLINGPQFMDADEDGLLEGVSTSRSTALTFWPSDGAVGILPTTFGFEYPEGTRCEYLQVHDFNQDGHDDLVLSFFNTADHTDLTFGFWEGQGQGVYPDSYESFQKFPRIGDGKFLIGDFSGDGLDDLYIYRASSNGPNVIYRFLGEGFDHGTLITPALSEPIAADLNGDGLLDIIGRNVDRIQVLLNKGGLEFELIEEPGPQDYDYGQIHLGNVNGDAYPDLIFYRLRSFGLYYGNGDGTFRKDLGDGVFPISDVAFIDMEGNGSSDILLRDEVGQLRVMLNDGRGNFCSPTLQFGYSDADSIRPRQLDFNRDGDLDLHLGNSIWLLDSVRSLRVDPGEIAVDDPAGTVIGTVKASISDHSGPYTYELFSDYTDLGKYFDLKGDQLILQTELPQDVFAHVSLYIRISNAEGNVGSSFLNFDIKKPPAEGVKPNPPVGEYRYELPKYLVMARHIERALYLRVPDENRSPSFHYVAGVGDRDNGRFEIDLHFRYGKIVFSPVAIGPRWYSFRLQASIEEWEFPVVFGYESIIQVLMATHHGGPYTFDIHDLLNMPAIARLEISVAPEFGTAEVVGDTIVYSPPADIGKMDDSFYYVVEDDGGSQHTVQAVVGFDHDLDMDGLFDWFEGQEFGSSYTRWDTDFDGFDDWLEYMTGSDPLDPAQQFRIERVEANGDGVVVTFTGSPERRYSVQQLLDDGWSTVPGYDRIPGSAPEPTHATIPLAPAAGGFFRVIAHTP